MNHYLDNDPKKVKYIVTGRMSVGELISLLQHMNSDYQQPWIDELSYSYVSESNLSDVQLSVVRDRPFKPETVTKRD